jgi:precorrin-6B methylase 2
MRHATWLKIEASPFWHGAYRRYRLLPDSVRKPLRALLMPQWQIAAFLVRHASRHRAVTGPFRGMRIELSPLSSRHLLGYILGSQELELREAIEEIAAREYRTILNIGAADGYYAVGLAMRAPQARIVAFEALPELHPVIARTAAANGVTSRISIEGTCTSALLRARLDAAKGPTLILMDIEGGEIELLDPRAVPELARADVLVETHDAFVADATTTLVDRFGATHDIACYTARPRVLSDFPSDFLPNLRRWFPRLAVELMNERRTGLQRWLLLTAKAPASVARATETAVSA